MVDVTYADREAAGFWIARNSACDFSTQEERDMLESALAAHRTESTADLQAKLDIAVEALQKVGSQAVCFPLARNMDECLDMLENCMRISDKAHAAIKEDRDMKAATGIITRLIGYAEHDDDCRYNTHYSDCTCGYSEAIAEAREFMESNGN